MTSQGTFLNSKHLATYREAIVHVLTPKRLERTRYFRNQMQIATVLVEDDNKVHVFCFLGLKAGEKLAQNDHIGTNSLLSVH